MLSLLKSNIVIFFQFFIFFFVFHQFFNPNCWLSSHNPIQDPNIFFLQLFMSVITLVFFNSGHVICLSFDVGASGDKVVGRCMENFRHSFRVTFTFLVLIGALSVNYTFNFLKKNFVSMFNLRCSVVFQLNCFCIGYLE